MEMIRLSRSSISDEPIRIASEQSAIKITAEKGSKAVIIDELYASDERARTIEIDLQENADVRYISLAATTGNGSIRMHQSSTIAQGAHMHWINATLGNNIVHEMNNTVIGKDGTSDVDWMFYAKEQENQTLSVRNIFAAKNGAGEIVMQGVAQDHAHVKCNGMIDIELSGGGTDTYLTQSVLMLDPTAKVDAIPGLEIKTNDVKASHSATVSRVSPEDLFYFASRGIDEHQAKSMYVEGFVLAPLEKIEDRIIRNAITSAVAAHQA